ncbi:MULTISPECIES: hypothetical protein [Pseudoalteromonas]|uniref:Membrane fusion protein biotin-lipoyl like domain-containing protein n=1 Tax=Pseudoalteromonas amylolytica TaxID=1859457 RepID=A0A1S1MP15_9GAMM|nr:MULTISPECIES: hypothetical protein [Pseudoalteromonas]MCF6437405.1 hypothetical protein [Pseudoalteromonas sp. MMG022]OHU84782.1 hypothetical protein BFC16_00415 [Pseudoalteromonas sp. JW3]OHU86461.1 hypothetical protein BET10_01820 [Pseudoalteromonas amylolytica]
MIELNGLLVAPLMMTTLVGKLTFQAPTTEFYYAREAGVVVESVFEPGNIVQKGDVILKYLTELDRETLQQLNVNQEGFVDYVRRASEQGGSYSSGDILAKISSNTSMGVLLVEGPVFQDASKLKQLWTCLNGLKKRVVVDGVHDNQILLSIKLSESDYSNKVWYQNESQVTLSTNERPCAQ